MVVLTAFQPGVRLFEEIQHIDDSFEQGEKPEEYLAICKELGEEARELETLRLAQNDWQAVNEEGARNFFRELLDRHPESPAHHYLYGRLIKQEKEALYHARRAIELGPNWSYGYRLLMNIYSGCLFHQECTRKVQEYLAHELPEDRTYFELVFDITPEEGSLLGYVFEYYLYTHRPKEAEAVIKKAKKLKQDWALDFDAKLLVRANRGDHKWLRRYVSDVLKWKVSQGYLDKNRLEPAIIDQLVYYYRMGHAYEYGLDMLREYEKHAPDEQYGAINFDKARFFSLLGREEEAFTCLFRAIDQGFDNAERIERHSCLNPLIADPRWEEVLFGIRTNWLKGVNERKKTALAKRMNIVAPEFALPDDRGQIIHLHDLRGKVVVLDFWATHCAPCRKGMPELSEYTRHDAKPDVQVFSVNVRNENPAYAKAFLDKRRYKTTLLFSDERTKQAYGIHSIPVLIIIDREGVIQFREDGFHFGLRERLNWWTKDLLGE